MTFAPNALPILDPPLRLALKQAEVSICIKGDEVVLTS